jgi:hypothetical protein
MMCESSSESYKTWLLLADKSWTRWDWDHLIETYSRRKLSFASDRLPALAALAEKIQPMIGGEYVCGFWKKDLQEQLQWRAIYSCQPLPGAEHPEQTYDAPTFSWMSIRNHNEIHLRNILSTTDSHVRFETSILNIHCTLKGANKYGKVIDGFLAVEGPLIKVNLKVEMKCDFPLQLSQSASEGQGVKTWYAVDTWGRGSTKLDTPLILTTVPNAMLEPEQTLQRTFGNDFLPVVEGPVWLLHYASSSNFRVIFILGLSRRVPGAYERLGILDVPHYMYKNPGDWSRHHDEWFGQSVRTIITIV